MNATRRATVRFLFGNAVGAACAAWLSVRYIHTPRPDGRLWAKVWLRWYSPLWQNRWTGFCLGLALILPSFTSRNRVQQQLELARKYDLSKRVTILLALAFTWASISSLKGFLMGPSFFSSSGVRAASDDGFFGVLSCVAAIQFLYAAWLMLRKSSDQSSQNPATPINHV